MRSRIAAAVILTSLFMSPSGARSANPIAKSLRCRKTIAGSIAQLTSAGLNQITACHAKRDKGKTTADCNVLGSGPFLAARNRASGKVSALCGRDPYLDRFTTGTVDASVFGATQRALEASGRDVEGAPTLSGDKAKSKCHLAIAKARNAVVLAKVKQDTGCQKGLDKSKTTLDGLGVIAPDCLSGTSSAESTARAGIGKACNGLTGADVGSCSPLPDCVISSAMTTASDLARYGYGPCGDGIRDADAGEQCDDGNDVNTDACASCKNATCGDGFVEAGVEECDDGNTDDTDACAQCKNATCGDGFVEAGVEECDDGNDVPDDGCTNCKADHVTCGDRGMDAMVTLVDSVTAAHDISGLTLNLVYGPPLTLPEAGGGAAIVARVTDLSGAGGLSALNNQDTNGDHVTDTLTNAYVSITATVPLAAFERVRFDCADTTPFSPASVHCVVKDGSDSNGIPLDASQIPACRVELVPASSGATTTTTSTSPPTTTTTPASTTSTSTTVLATTTTSSTVVGATTTTSTIPATPVCGDNIVETGETCDDGNTVDGDTCPSNCRIESCTPTASTRTFSVTVTPPAGVTLGGVTVFVNYPEGKVDLAGHGNDNSVKQAITGLPGGALTTPNDLDYGLIEVIASTGALPSGKLFTMTMADCAGATTATPADFTCTVTDAADTTFNTVTGATCSVSTP